MNREHWAKMLPIITAFAEGKTVQYRNDDGSWADAEYPRFDGMVRDYRIKPTHRLRPWKPDEVPVGAVVRSKRSKADRWQITGVNAAGIALSCDSARDPFSEMLSDWEMLDGSPCGVEVSE